MIRLVRPKKAIEVHLFQRRREIAFLLSSDMSSKELI